MTKEEQFIEEITKLLQHSWRYFDLRDYLARKGCPLQRVEEVSEALRLLRDTMEIVRENIG